MSNSPGVSMVHEATGFAEELTALTAIGVGSVLSAGNVARSRRRARVRSRGDGLDSGLEAAARHSHVKDLFVAAAAISAAAAAVNKPSAVRLFVAAAAGRQMSRNGHKVIGLVTASAGVVARWNRSRTAAAAQQAAAQQAAAQQAAAQQAAAQQTAPVYQQPQTAMRPTPTL